jgi:transglutaminase-like putative cysteine protease
MGSYRRTTAAAAATILASLSLYPIFYGFAWFWTGVAAVLTVAVAGTLTRLRRLPVLVCLAGGLVALLLDLNIGYESPTSLFRVLPTPTSLRLLWDLVGLGFQESAKYAPPVPELPPMMFLATAGIGLTALLTDFIAVRLESAALAGLPLLLLFTEPFTLSVSRTGIGMVVAFCLGTAGYLALLSSEGRDRIREWERPNPGPDELPDTRALATTGRRVGVASVALALCVPLFIPGLHATRLFSNGQPGIGGTGGTGTGAGVGFPDPNTQLSQQLHESRPQEVFSYTSSDATPQYFQVYVLDNLTASGWTMFSQPESLVNATPRLPAAPGLRQTTYASSENTFVTLSRAVGQDELSALPVPYPATTVVAQGQLRADKSTLMVFDTGVQLSGLTYLVTSLDQSPPAQALNETPAAPADITNHYTSVPSSYQPLRQVAEQVVNAAKAKTQFQEAVALQDWLTSSAFKYTTDAPSIVDARGLATFLTSTKRGYCQQFSFAMAVLARLLGIPSRVAYGYTAGTSEPGGTWEVTTHDAHAWPELYFQGYGWLRFEPTPSGADGQGTATSPSYTQQPASVFQQSPGFSGKTGTSGSTGTTPGDSAALKHQLNISLGSGNSGAGAVAPAGLSGWQIFGLAVLGLLVLIMLAMAIPAGARLLVRRWRWRKAHRHGGDGALAHAAWRELRDDLVDYRVGYSLSETPRALAARVSESLLLPPPEMAALRRVALAEERARYAGRPDTGTGLRQDSATIRRAISAASPRRTRWLARLFPSSVITPAMVRFSQAADFSGRLNSDLFGTTRIGTRRRGKTGPARAQSADETAARNRDALTTAGSRDR